MKSFDVLCIQCVMHGSVAVDSGWQSLREFSEGEIFKFKRLVRTVRCALRYFSLIGTIKTLELAL